MSKTINGYQRYLIEPNTIDKDARVYTKTIFFNTKNRFKNRLIRVYLPSTYDFDNPDKRFPVIYMMDGKNLFDDYTSFVGEWGIDEIVEDFIKERICDGFIVVGVDAPNENKGRTLEMSPDDIATKDEYFKGKGYADIFGNYIFNVVKPDIDKTFHTLDDKQHTYVGGSSMGGLMSYYLATHFEKFINAALCFSPAFFLLKENELDTFLESSLKKNLPNLYFYVGGVGFESVFVDSTKHVYDFYLANRKDLKLTYIFDENKEHNERAWREYFPSALKVILN